VPGVNKVDSSSDESNHIEGKIWVLDLPGNRCPIILCLLVCGKSVQHDNCSVIVAFEWRAGRMAAKLVVKQGLGLDSTFEYYKSLNSCYIFCEFIRNNEHFL
jgi:hypothetical protein